MLASKPEVTQRVKEEILSRVPVPNLRELTIEQYALESARANGYREAVEDLFHNLPNEQETTSLV